MKTLSFSLLSSVTVALCAGCGSFHHVPPGQSVAFAMAKRPEVVALPPEPQPTPAPAPRSALQPVANNIPDPQLTLPAQATGETDKAADSFALGNFCLAQGRNAEAIAAYETTVKLNPNFPDAWSKLAIAYQNAGDDKKALEAFKKSRMASAK